VVEVARVLRDEYGYTMLTDNTAIDFGEETSPRFTGIYHFFNPWYAEYIRVAVDCTGSDENPQLPTLTGLWPAANWHEREAYDMLGIEYTGHPDLRRILMWDGYPYFPLRREFPLAGQDAVWPEDDVVEVTAGGINPTAAPMMGGPFVAPQESTMSAREPQGRDESWTETKTKK